jgi:hypothetical protein
MNEVGQGQAVALLIPEVRDRLLYYAGRALARVLADRQYASAL